MTKGFIAQGRSDGGLHMATLTRIKFREFLQKNPGIRIQITPVLPESDKLRRYFEGAIIPLVTYYQEGLDHHDASHRELVREWIKQEFNAGMVMIGGKKHIIGKSTKGRENLNRIVEKIVDWLVENYEPPKEAIDPESYKHWRDIIFSEGGPDNYIDYLTEIKILRQ